MEKHYQKQWKLLKRMAELGKIPHALLFSGPAPQELKSLALEFVKSVTGQDIEKGVHPDLYLVEPQEDREIKISQIRELHSKLSLRAYISPLKAVIIDRAHYLNQEAQSAFLKLLEEPKGPTLFILITEYPEMLLPTILSRVERLRFYSFRHQTLPPEEIKRVSKIIRSDISERFQYAKELSEDPPNLKKVLEAWLGYFREILLSNPHQPKTIRILKTIQTIHFLLSTTNINPRLAMETLMLEL